MLTSHGVSTIILFVIYAAKHIVAWCCNHFLYQRCRRPLLRCAVPLFGTSSRLDATVLSCGDEEASLPDLFWGRWESVP